VQASRVAIRRSHHGRIRLAVLEKMALTVDDRLRQTRRIVSNRCCTFLISQRLPAVMRSWLPD